MSTQLEDLCIQCREKPAIPDGCFCSEECFNEYSQEEEHYAEIKAEEQRQKENNRAMWRQYEEMHSSDI